MYLFKAAMSTAFIQIGCVKTQWKYMAELFSSCTKMDSFGNREPGKVIDVICLAA